MLVYMLLWHELWVTDLHLTAMFDIRTFWRESESSIVRMCRAATLAAARREAIRRPSDVPRPGSFLIFSAMAVVGWNGLRRGEEK